MYGVKSFFASKTIWGGLVVLLATAANFAGYTIPDADQAQLIEIASNVAALIGALVAIWGRVRATKKIELVRQAGSER